jgi:hypothetical protein
VASVEVTTQQCPQTACSSFTQGAEQENLLLPRFTAEDVKDPAEFERLLSLTSDKIEKEFKDIFNPQNVLACPVTSGAVVLDTGRACAFTIETATDVNSITICCIEGLTCSFSVVAKNIGAKTITISGWPSSTSMGADVEFIEVQPGETANFNLVPDDECNWSAYQPVFRKPEPELEEPTEAPFKPSTPNVMVPSKTAPCSVKGEAAYQFYAATTDCYVDENEPENTRQFNTTCPDFVGDNFSVKGTGTPFEMACHGRSFPEERCELNFRISEGNPTEGDNYGIALLKHGVLDDDVYVRIVGGTPFNGDSGASGDFAPGISFGIGIQMLASSTASNFSGFVLAFENEQDNGHSGFNPVYQFNFRLYRCDAASTQRAQNGNNTAGSRPGWTLIESLGVFALIGTDIRIRRCGLLLSVRAGTLYKEFTLVRANTERIDPSYSVDKDRYQLYNKRDTTLPTSGSVGLISSTNGPLRDTVYNHGISQMLVDGYSIKPCGSFIGTSFRGDCDRPDTGVPR